MVSYDLRKLIIFCLCLWGVCAAGRAAGQQLTPADCGLPTNGMFTGTATFTLESDCDLSASLQPNTTWNVAANADITLNGNGFSLIGGDEGSGSPPFDDATFLTITTASGSKLTLNNIVLDSVRLRIEGQLFSSRLTYTGARNHGIFVFGNAYFECALFEDNLRKTGDPTGNTLTSLGANDDGAVSFFDTVFQSNLGGRATLAIINKSPAVESPFAFEGCLTQTNNAPRLWLSEDFEAGYISIGQADQCSGSMGASQADIQPCSPAAPSPRQNPEPKPTATPKPEPTPLPTLPPSPTPNYIRHTVCRGENLFRIAIAYCVSPKAIIEMNGLANGGERLYPGQELIIPVEAGADYHAEVIPYPPRADGSVVHIVGKMQTLGEIAQVYGVATSEIMRLNNLTGDVINPGQELLIRER